jgi:hypothetical protein
VRRSPAIRLGKRLDGHRAPAMGFVRRKGDDRKSREVETNIADLFVVVSYTGLRRHWYSIS